MQKFLLAFALLGAVNRNHAAIEPWPFTAIDGVVIQQDADRGIWAEWDRKLAVRSDLGFGVFDTDLAFATNADYKLGEKCIGQTVRVEGVPIRRGTDVWFVPRTMVEKTK